MTGSRVGDILQYNTSYAGAQRIDRFREYVKLDPPVQKTPAMEHGNRYEYCALYEFEEVMRLESHPVVSLPFNFLVCPTKPHYAYSPDGILNTGELVEIKCPERRVIVPGLFTGCLSPVLMLPQDTSRLTTTSRCSMVCIVLTDSRSPTATTLSTR